MVAPSDGYSNIHFKWQHHQMSDLILIVTGAVSILTVLLIVLIAWRGRNSSKASDEDNRARRAPPAQRAPRLGGDDGPRRPAGRPVRARNRNANRDQSEEEDDDPLADEIAMPDGKIGAKKRKKLEMKAEKRAARERELEDREEKKQRQALIEEERKREDELRKQEEKKREDEEKRLKEEKEQQELEEYLKLKEAFAVEEEGYDEDTNEGETQNKLHVFIEYIKNQKVVLLEDLAGHFQMKTQDAINRVQDLLAQEILVGVIDDRGKFIYIEKEELEAVAKFIKQRGRVSITELMESSVNLINLHKEVPIKA